MGLNAFLNLNPQIGGSAACSTKVWPGYYYCVHTKIAAPTSGTKEGHRTDEATARPRTTFSFKVVKTASPPSTTKNRTPTTTTPPPKSYATLDPAVHPTCHPGSCYDAFAEVKDASSLTDWCQYYTYDINPETRFGAIRSLNQGVSKACHSLGPANDVLSSYCNCYVAGAITKPPETSVSCHSIFHHSRNSRWHILVCQTLTLSP